MTMRPSAVRKRILREHAELRCQLDEMEVLTRLLEAGGSLHVKQTVDRARDFFEDLRDHIDLEDAILAPVLRDTPGWGDQRADDLTDHHREQRTQLLELLGDLRAETPPETLAKHLTVVIEEVRVDMQQEERTLLNSELLRDDLIGIDVSDG